LAPNGLKNASRDRHVIVGWFQDQPWNLGIATGSKSGVVALDIDPRHGGDHSLAALERENGQLPTTWRFLTGGGGEHVLFRCPNGIVPNSAQKIAPGIDVRGDGGYIVAPPSRHASGRSYAISVDHHPDEIALAEPPSWLIDLLKATPTGGTSPHEWRQHFRSSIPEGQRNDALARFSVQ
jgi:hypothetical protein